MTDSQCLTYLQQQSQSLQNEKSKLSNKLNSEQYNQLSLLEKIKYIDNDIASSENQIKQLELQIETKNVEIRILGRDILDLQNNIDTVSQEVGKLNSAIEKRMSLTYKYSFISPLEIFLESSNFDSLLRRFKYLAETRKKDSVLLDELSIKANILKKEEIVLANKKKDVEKKKTEIEASKTELFSEKTSLEKQRGEKSTLLAQSKQKAEDYNAQLKTLKKQEDKITATISNLIFSLYSKGQLPANTPVKKGDIVGFQGHTGLAFGSHLHFELRKNGSIISPYSTGHFSYPNGSASSRFPIDNAIVTQYPHGGNYAVDMVSGNDYLYQRWDKYYTKGVSCYGYRVPAGYYYLNGEGAPLRAIRDGKVTKVFTDACGGKAVIVDYGGGLTSMYLHLR
jgi:peptidoglycan hydrolase CwlO-like protein